jgi:transformation/transcription domain-associated protein
MFADNELVLQPYLAVIVKTGIKSAMSAKRPDNFLLLIRALFRRVAAGKFELLYKEFVPLLPGMCL